VKLAEQEEACQASKPAYMFVYLHALSHIMARSRSEGQAGISHLYWATAHTTGKLSSTESGQLNHGFGSDYKMAPVALVYSWLW
jgi:hypothetical protein